jgi:hypothetical protein
MTRAPGAIISLRAERVEMATHLEYIEERRRG